MTDKDRGLVIDWLEEIVSDPEGWQRFYSSSEQKLLAEDALALLKEQEVEHRQLLSWLGKFCRHIDNGDAWLTDEENIAFFKEKMKQQFGWDTD